MSGKIPTMFNGLELSPDKFNRKVTITTLRGATGTVYYQVAIQLYVHKGEARPDEAFVFRNQKSAFKYAASYLEA